MNVHLKPTAAIICRTTLAAFLALLYLVFAPRPAGSGTLSASVIALFPFGLIKKLRYLPGEDIW